MNQTDDTQTRQLWSVWYESRRHGTDSAECSHQRQGQRRLCKQLSALTLWQDNVSVLVHVVRVAVVPGEDENISQSDPSELGLSGSPHRVE